MFILLNSSVKICSFLTLAEINMMNAKKVIRLAVAATAVSFAQFAAAEGLYVVGSFGLPSTNKVRTDFDATIKKDLGLTVNSSLKMGTAMDGALGYAFNKNLAIEGGYFNSGTGALTVTVSGDAISVDTKTTIMRLDVVGSLPLSDKLSVFGKLGYAGATTDVSAIRVNNTAVEPASSSSENKIGFGIGARYAFMDKFSARVSWDSMPGDVSAILLGLQVNF